jgi:hypothetical protein
LIFVDLHLRFSRLPFSLSGGRKPPERACFLFFIPAHGPNAPRSESVELSLQLYAVPSALAIVLWRHCLGGAQMQSTG